MYTQDETFTEVNFRDEENMYIFSDFIENVDYMLASGEYNTVEIEQFIQSEADKLETTELNEELQAEITNIILKSYFAVSEGRGVIGISKEYESFVNEHINDEIIKEICYDAISFRKWAEYRYFNEPDSQNKFEPCAWRDCFDCCMLRRIEGMNAVDWFFFITGGIPPGGGPGASTLVLASGCIFACL